MRANSSIGVSNIGDIIFDPCLSEQKMSRPLLLYIPLKVCRKLDTSKNCPMYWGTKIKLPPMPLDFIWKMVNQTEYPNPGMSMKYKIAKEEANCGIVLLKKPTKYHAPGYFEVHDWSGNSEEAEKIKKIIK